MFRDASRALAVVALCAVVAGCGGRSRRTVPGPDGGIAGLRYSTDFDAAEAPLSEDGAWHHEGTPWTAVESAEGVAFGTQPVASDRVANEDYNDSYAYLSGFPPDQQASATIHLGTVDPSCTHEVELLLRWADSPDSARGYECNLSYNGSYVHIVRWDGPLGEFTFLSSGNVPSGIRDGDTFSASAVGDRLALSVNGVVLASARDTTFTSGNPGIGFYRGIPGCGTFGDFGFTSFTAGSIE
jgi:hypothetical protein